MPSPHDRQTHNRLLHGPVGPTLLRLAAPMAMGIAAIMLFNVVDTFYVGRLGAEPLAAMSFTFPVAYFVMSLAMGMGIGTTSVLSRLIGHGDHRRVRRLATHSLLLANLMVVIVALVGLFTLRPLFTALGAPPHLLPRIEEYMVPWYLGIGFLVIPMVGNSAIRATGDTKTPSYIMMFAGLVNVVLDPLLIFGIGPFPRLELQGAALATVISWVLTFAAALWVLGKRLRLIELVRPSLAALWDSWRQVLFVGVPASVTHVLMPVGAGILTRFMAAHGTGAVAAFGVGYRIEALAMLGVAALSAALSPFAGQNHGAGNCDRVRAALVFAVKATLAYGLVMAALLAGLAGPLARLFSDSDEIRATVSVFLWVVPLSYGLYGAALLVNSLLNAVGRPLSSAALTLVRLFVFAIPLAYLGSRWAGVPGILVGMSAANLLGGVAALVVGRRFLSRVEAATALESVERHPAESPA